MAYTKKEISNALETITAPGEGINLIESGAVKNIVTFDKEIIVDVTIGNPTLQAKKKMEVEIMKAIHQHVDVKADVKVNVTALIPTKQVKIKE
ncbi:MAG: iron-sulfur cluster assembly protein, partial [Lutibacter sp.]|nr:iron-sulfur cluster assembly protein [Lutibacter sp.]